MPVLGRVVVVVVGWMVIGDERLEWTVEWLWVERTQFGRSWVEWTLLERLLVWWEWR